MRVQGVGQRRKEIRRFMWYSLYGWSLPLGITAFAKIAQDYRFLPKNLTPDIGHISCFFHTSSEKYAYALFFMLPITLLTCCNTILFLRTTHYCYKVKSEISKMKDSNQSTKEKKKIFFADRERLGVLFKLFIIMGIAWIFEGLSVFLPFRKQTVVGAIELIIDCYNASEGILIFCVFMLKKKVYRSFKKRFCKIKQRKISSQGTTTSTVSLPNNNMVVKKFT